MTNLFPDQRVNVNISDVPEPHHDVFKALSTWSVWDGSDPAIVIAKEMGKAHASVLAAGRWLGDRTLRVDSLYGGVFGVRVKRGRWTCIESLTVDHGDLVAGMLHKPKAEPTNGTPRKSAHGLDKVLFVRTDQDLLNRLDELRKRRSEKAPGVVISRSDVARSILWDGLARAEDMVDE